MFCLHCLGVIRNMKAREMLNYLHHLEFKFPVAATRYSPSLHPAEPSCVARIIPRRTVWRIREMISRSWLGPAVEEHFGKITKPCHENQPKFYICTHILKNHVGVDICLFDMSAYASSFSHSDLTSSKLSKSMKAKVTFLQTFI